MGVNISKIVIREKTSFEELSGRKIALDAYNALYQFLSIIRDASGNPLRDSHGNITSHLSGLFYRTVNLIEYGLQPVYVFDGKSPERKLREIARRKKIREESKLKYLKALEEGRLEEARRYAAAATILESYMVEDAKKLLKAMGVPIVQAPSEGEAQAAYMAIKGDVWAAGSQDYDSLLFGSPRVVRNITLTGKVHYPSKGIAVKLEPEIIDLKRVLEANKITREQLIDIGILVGTDYNEGVKGIGPKKALELIKRYKRIENIPGIGEKINLEEVNEVREIFLKPEVTDDYDVSMKPIDEDEIINFLCYERDFSETRVKKAIRRIKEKLSKRSLDLWFG
ncbi:flap endonuclease-1 [Candidatus Geothermarchaeota archaeon]|nr:MAG: flap endonuclease-1 [Candidatus Geothermarchaeota archaeon]